MRGSSSHSTTTSAVHCASGVALPRLTDTCACASDGASLMPSPTIATTAPAACSARDGRALVFRLRVAARVGDAERPRRSPPRSRAGRPTAAPATMPSALQARDERRGARAQRVAEREQRDEPVGVAQRDPRRRRRRRRRRRPAAARPDSAATKAGRPRRTRRPAMVAFDAVARTDRDVARPAAATTGPPRASRNARASGCSDGASSAAASASASARVADPSGSDVQQRDAPGRQRAGLVEHDVRDARQRLQRVARAR